MQQVLRPLTMFRGDISSITPQMKFVPGTVLTVDPANTNHKALNLITLQSNTVQVE